jgi:hypothetical protein
MILTSGTRTGLKESSHHSADILYFSQRNKVALAPDARDEVVNGHHTCPITAFTRHVDLWLVINPPPQLLR